MKSVICIGSSSKDIFFPTSEGIISETLGDLASQRKITFELGAKYHIGDRFESLGGCGANQAIGLSRLGVQALCYTSIGDDAVGDWIKSEFNKEKIKQDLVQTERNSLSGLSAIVVDKNSGERIIFSNQEANEKLTVDPEKLVGTDFISVTDLSGDWIGVMETVINFCGQNKIRVAYNPRGINIKQDPEKVFEFSGKSEIFFVNKDEAIEIISSKTINKADANLNDEKFLTEELKKSGVKVAIITDGKRGAWVTDGDKLLWAGALGIQPVETTGAGDAFSSGFLAARIKGKDLEECLKWGIANSGNSVKFYGSIAGLLDEENIQKNIEKIEVEIIN